MIEAKMKVGTLLILFFNAPLVLMLNYEKPVPAKIWSERCSKNMIALNDCNWCRCGPKSTYTCDARACKEVGMFGHFNDAIFEMDVGMEGRGVWRSNDGACEPGVHYHKDDLLCVCNEDGKWPNPVCRDIFQILHSVETTEHKQPEENISCSATKLYLFGCNVCFCPASGQIDPKLCTNKRCEDDNIKRTHPRDTAEEIYATCTANKAYKLGCHTCMCLRNNRLLCNNCTDQAYHKGLPGHSGHTSECHSKKPGSVFKKDCNLCHCDKNETMYCTVKNCLKSYTYISLPKFKYARVAKIENEQNCVPNTKFKKNCNTCHCIVDDGVKYLGCTTNTCKSSNFSIDTSCVEGTSYQLNCMICHCVLDKGVKREYCTVDDTCTEKSIVPHTLSSMHGYCEPLHVYQQDCNECKCLADGKTVACTSKICSERKDDVLKKKNRFLKGFRAELEANIKKAPPADDKALVMELIPFTQRGYSCPKGQTYMVGCNICYCMDTGNAVCTTKKC